MDLNKGQRFIYEHHHYHHYKNENLLFNNDLRTDDGTCSSLNQSNRKWKSKGKKLKKDSRSDSLYDKQQSQHEDIIKKSASDPEATSSNQTNQSPVPIFNFTRNLTKKCFKSFKLRRAIKKQKYLFNTLDLFSTTKQQANKEIQSQAKISTQNTSNSNSRVNILSDDSSEKMGKFFDDKLSTSSNCLRNEVFGDDEIENDFLSLNNSKTNISFNKSNKFLADSNCFNYFDNSDTLDFNRSLRSSAWDFDDLTGRYI